MGNVIRIRSHFGTFPSRVKHVSLAKESPTAFRSFKEHPVAARVWWAICYAMLHHVDIDAGARRLVEALLMGAPHYLLNGEIDSLGVFALDKRGGYPNFIGDF
jgi:hypothetical protein